MTGCAAILFFYRLIPEIDKRRAADGSRRVRPRVAGLPRRQPFILGIAMSEKRM
jgi:hypothetical protein